MGVSPCALDRRYVLEGEVGRGAAAVVYRGRDLKHERPVAVKVLHPSAATAVGAERFGQEIEITARLQHPHILPLLDSGSDNGLLYSVMPYVEGGSLRQRLQSGRPLSIDEVLRLGREIADALAYAHRRGIAHLDVKPENVLLSDGHAMIADFGIARAICDCSRERADGPMALVGTPDYMSPEQADGPSALDGRSDVYSLACVLYEMATGTPPFRGARAEWIIAQHWTASPMSARRLRPDVPPALDRTLSQALAKDPTARPTAEQVVTVLQAIWLAAQPVTLPDVVRSGNGNSAHSVA